MKNSSFKFLVGLLVVALGIYLAIESAPYLSLDYLKASQQGLKQFREAHPGQVELLYFLVYILSAALSVPGAGILTLAGGALFGITAGSLLVSFASTVGATLSFLLTRYLLKDWARKRFQASFKKIDQGFESEGRMYLFSLRLIPTFPFFAVNSMMALTKIKVSEFYWISQVGMLPGTLAYVWAGQEVAGLTSLSGLLSPSMLGAFTALGLLPWMVTFGLARWRRHQAIFGL